MATRKEKISLPATKIIIGGYMAFSVLRCAKVKANEVSKVHNHNFRTYENHSAENVNFERNKNKVVLGSSIHIQN